MVFPDLDQSTDDLILQKGFCMQKIAFYVTDSKRSQLQNCAEYLYLSVTTQTIIYCPQT